MRIIGVNGIATHGEGNIDVMLAKLSALGYETVDVKLPMRHFISARWGAWNDAEIIADNSSDGDVVICHSFGCLRTAKAMMWRRYRCVFMFAPAMSKHYRFPLSIHTSVYCFCSPDDTALKLGRLLLLHPFGSAGLVGFSRPRLKNPAVHNIQSRGDHNAYFEGYRLLHNVDFIDQRLRGD